MLLSTGTSWLSAVCFASIAEGVGHYSAHSSIFKLSPCSFAIFGRIRYSGPKFFDYSRFASDVVAARTMIAFAPILHP